MILSAVIPNLRVLIVADDLLARTGLAALLTNHCTIVGQVAGDDQISVAVEAYRPDVIVWDLGWDPSATLELLAESVEAGPPIVALLGDETYAPEIWVSGVQGLLLRRSDADTLVAALAAATHALAVFDPTLASRLISRREHSPSPPAALLTPREHEVLQLMAEGLSNKAIALRLSISDHTVKFHINAILRKLDAQSRTEAVIQATRLGLILL